MKKGVFHHLFKGVQIEVSRVERNEAKDSGKKQAENPFAHLERKPLKISSGTKISEILDHYDKRAITIGALGGHSALDVCRGAKKYGFRTVVVCQKGREATYAKYYKARDSGKGIVDEVILVDKFSDITKKDVQQKLRDLNTIFVHNRYFWVYCNFKDIEKNFKVPIYGTRSMVKLEERDQPKNQYYLLSKAGVRMPKLF
ncbi:MAG TPA: DUF1246 domain-containing protein, partial [Candidatus Nanoarchaeia archaeon]|nr:DUF1246 domain-containing protein [Candidatus Nanoarchaeia archaeon]